MTWLKMQDLDLKGKRVLIRVDFNVPIKDNKVISDARILAALPTIELALKAGAKVMLLSHLGRPTEGTFDEEFSLEPVAKHLEVCLKQPVNLAKDWLSGILDEGNAITLCENVRFNKGEKANDDQLAKKMAALCDVFVMDAFGTAHRAQASTYGVAKYAPIACAGPLLTTELNALDKALSNPKRPLLAIVGGAKVSSKLKVLHSLAEKADQLIVGGGIANTFLAATGQPVGKSLYEPDLVDEAKQIISTISKEGGFVPLPIDVCVSESFSENAPCTVKPATEVEKEEMILDVGPETRKTLVKLIKQAGTILWNGPLGVFEFEAFAKGTEALAKAVADSEAFSLAGGGDTIAAIEKYQIEHKISYISTGGGAFLEYVEGKTLPAVEILMQRAKDKVWS